MSRHIDANELKTILENHAHWIHRDCDGWEQMKADLSGANLRGANLHRANLGGADLGCADLRCADLSSANLRYADLCRADLRRADLSCAELNGVDLSGADLSGATGARTSLACPSDGGFVGWKKAKSEHCFVIVKLWIPDDAKRSSATGKKCRCDKAKVLAFYGMNGEPYLDSTIAYSLHDAKFEYEVGKMVSVSDFDENRFNECAPGIHFFVDRAEAERY